MEAVRVLLDTNIVLDFFTGRMGDGMATKLVQIGRSGRYEMCISFLTAINTMYVAKKAGAQLEASDISSVFTILNQDASQWNEAQNLELSDFEDATQAACALSNNCFICISRDHHLNKAPMAVFSPSEFLSAVLD